MSLTAMSLTALWPAPVQLGRLVRVVQAMRCSHMTVTSSEAPGPAHPCDAPGLSPIEFLQAIYRDRTLPMSIRIDAARGLLPFTEPAPRPVVQGPTLTIVIGGIEDPEQIIGETQSNFDFRPARPQPLWTTPGQSYIEKTLERMSLSEIIKTIANTPEHLLPICTICNFPMIYPCSVDPHPPTYTDPSTLPCVTRHTRTGETVH